MLSLKLFALLATIFASSVVAQVSFVDLPSCVKSAILGYVGRGNCDVVDTNCICEDASIIDFIGKAVGANCDKSDIGKLVSFAEQLCPKLQTTTYDALHSTTIIFQGVGASSTATTTSSSSSSESSGSVVTTSPTLSFSLLSSTPTSTATTSSATATATSNSTSHNGTTVTPFPGAASQSPGFGMVRLVSMVIGIVVVGMLFADL
ncbi:uncharacterized protein BKA78DRAFT_352565 [Phyllosticta capitalensis]|uniref:uncharacterized protein n=1 Tax=Phyllosticta capitalensis TaxID=121624 RepID=UPI00312E83FE